MCKINLTNTRLEAENITARPTQRTRDFLNLRQMSEFPFETFHKFAQFRRENYQGRKTGDCRLLVQIDVRMLALQRLITGEESNTLNRKSLNKFLISASVM